jgi:RimJ/RimL family protein N-acetyltransferase
MHPVLITGERLCLREFEPSDAEALQKVYGDPDATRYLSFEPRSPEQVERIIGAAIESGAVPDRLEYMLAVAESATYELVGAARLALGEYDSAQIGFALRRDQWGLGKGQETVRLLLRLGFSELGLHRIWGARSPLNERSARTMEAAGMVEEGRIRGHLFSRGAWRDSIVHSVLADEYAAAEHADVR